ncbi:MAG: hypothetical protein WCY84_06135 [Candidatus Cloacimonadaceae bacterium]
MKVKLKYGISAYSGTIDDMTYSSHKDGAFCIGRKYVKPRYTENNEYMGKVSKNLGNIYADCSDDFKEDLRTYAYLFDGQKASKRKMSPNGYSHFISMMYAFAKANASSIGLDTVTLGDLQTLFEDVTSVASAVESGFLPKVKGYEALTANM